MKPVFQWVYAQQPDHTAKSDLRNATSSSAISNRIEQAFDSASQTTGTSFEYLLQTAQRESSMNPQAKAPTSSAAGLFQFIESTWLETMKSSGAELGLGDLADKIDVDASGRHRVADAEDRQAILALRYDPEIASMMAGALTRRNAETLTARLGREPSAGELYIAHFLGAQGASKLIGLAASSPDASAADHFPKQAAANRSIFFEKGEAKSLSAVYAELVGQHGGDTPLAETPLLAFAGQTDSSDALKALDMATPENRVRSGWNAAAPSDAFTALFRTDHPEMKAMAATAFWQGYLQAPGLFDVAVAEDARLMASEIAVASPAVLPANPASASSLAGAAARGGPLDLARFLDIDET